MSPTENSNQVFLPGGATNSQNSPYISVWPLDHIDAVYFSLSLAVFCLVVNPILVYSPGLLFHCMLVDQTSDSMKSLT